MKPNYESLSEANIITARINSNISLEVDTAYVGVTIPMTNIEYNIGDCFSLSDGKIKINKAGYYKVSGNLIVTGAINGSTQVMQLSKNGSRIVSAYQYVARDSYINLCISPRIIYAEAGDVISMELSSNVTSTPFTVAGGSYTYMTVEKIN